MAPSDVAFGLSRMYELLRTNDPSATEDICVFWEMDEAPSWLRAGG